jgi:uncharacterized membrane protein
VALPVFSSAWAIAPNGRIGGEISGGATVFNGPTQIIAGAVKPSQVLGLSNDYAVGQYTNQGCCERAFISNLATGTTTTLGVFAGHARSSAAGVNAVGRVVGYSSGANVQRAVLWQQSGQPIDLDPANAGPGNAAAATAINDKGQIVGWRGFVGAEANRAFFYDPQLGISQIPGDFSSPLFGASVSEAAGINNNGQVVGNVRVYNNVNPNFPTGYGAFLWAGGSRIDLDAAVFVGGTTQQVRTATAINNHGQIAANSQDGRALLLTPTGFVTWAGPNNGELGVNTNWDSGDMGFGPNKFLSASIDAPAAAVTARLSGSITTPVLLLGATNATGQATLWMNSGHLDGRLSIGSRGVLTGGGVIDGEVTNSGFITLVQPGDDLRFRSGLINHGLVSGNGLLLAELDNRSAGTVLATNAQTVLIIGNQHTNAGTLRVNSGSQMELRGAVLNTAGGLIDSAGRITFSDGLDNDGLISLSLANGPAVVAGDVHNRSGSRITLAVTAQGDIEGRLVNDGLVVASSASLLRYLDRVSGHGSFSAGTGARHVFGGGFAPGSLADPTAIVSVAQAQFSSAVEFDLAGYTAGQGHDRIQFTSGVWFENGSSVIVRLRGGFVPEEGDEFDLFTFANAPQVSLALLQLDALPAGLVWDSSTLFTNGYLKVAAVPEPGSWALMLVGLLSLPRLLRRRRAQALR